MADTETGIGQKLTHPAVTSAATLAVILYVGLTSLPPEATAFLLMLWTASFSVPYGLSMLEGNGDD